MKLTIVKNIIKGKYHVFVSVNEFTAEEKILMDKFGVPSISVKPSSAVFNARYTDLLPLDKINHQFQFINALTAETFAEEIKRRINIAVAILKRREDKFSDTQQYEI